jgi:hypothetical protein
MGRTEIAGFQPQTHKTLQSDARKTTISQHEINDMGVVQGERSKARQFGTSLCVRGIDGAARHQEATAFRGSA